MANYWLKSGVLTLLQRMSTVLFGFGTFYVLVRSLDKSDFGAWSLFITVTTLFETIRSGLVQNSMVKFLANADDAEKSGIISASFTISGLLTLLSIIINLLFAKYLSVLWNTPQLEGMFHLYSIVYAISWILSQFQFIEQAHFRFQGLFLSTSIRYGSLFVFVLAASIFEREITLKGLVYVQMVAVLLATLVSYAHVRNLLPSSVSFSRSWVEKIFHFGKYVFGTSVSSVIFNSINQAMLGGMISTAATASYNIAVRITNLVEIPTSSVAAIVFPQSAKRIETHGKEAVRQLYEKSVAAILAILLPGFLIMLIFSGPVVTFVAGERYSESIPILNVTLLNCLLIPFGRQFGTILDSIGKPKTTFKNVMLSAAINIVLNYFFIKEMGVMGAAYATFLAGLIGFVIAQTILKRELNVSLLKVAQYVGSFYGTLFRRYIIRQ